MCVSVWCGIGVLALFLSATVLPPHLPSYLIDSLVVHRHTVVQFLQHLRCLHEYECVFVIHTHTHTHTHTYMYVWMDVCMDVWMSMNAYS